ncbi:MAG: hypothetical protein MUQ10_10880 [Anaerolineae bacterium]|nr:hypothetical protein [Anaerolineae bacterium]
MRDRHPLYQAGGLDADVGLGLADERGQADDAASLAGREMDWVAQREAQDALTEVCSQAQCTTLRVTCASKGSKSRSLWSNHVPLTMANVAIRQSMVLRTVIPFRRRAR